MIVTLPGFHPLLQKHLGRALVKDKVQALGLGLVFDQFTALQSPLKRYALTHTATPKCVPIGIRGNSWVDGLLMLANEELHPLTEIGTRLIEHHGLDKAHMMAWIFPHYIICQSYHPAVAPIAGYHPDPLTGHERLNLQREMTHTLNTWAVNPHLLRKILK